MRRLLSLAVVAATILGTAPTARAAAPTPTPPPTAGAPARHDPNTDDVCQKAQAVVQDSVQAFVKELDKAGTLADNVDLHGALEAIKQAGTVLIDLSGRLHSVAVIAGNADLKKALENLAAELNTLGQRLASLTGLKTFDTTQLDAFFERVSQLCGG